MSDDFFNECKKNAFFWWGITNFFLVLLYSFSVFDIVLQSIINYRLDILFIFVAITLTMIISLYPIMQGLKRYASEVSRKSASFFIIVLFGIIFADSIYSLLDFPIIMGKLHSALSDKIIDNTIIIQVIVQFLAIPLLYAFLITMTKKELAKKNFEISDEFKNNRRFAGEIVLINSVICVVALLIVK